jgi:hypothetical protein
MEELLVINTGVTNSGEMSGKKHSGKMDLGE